MAKTDLTRTSEAIDGEYAVILPPPPIRWSFWEDDFPALVKIIVGPPIVGLIGFAIHRLMH